MGYFSTGTEGAEYQSQHCSHCVHDGACAVWLAHMLHNYDDCNKKGSILHLLIPRRKDGPGNEKCRMFHTASEDDQVDPNLPLKGEVCVLPGEAT